MPWVTTEEAAEILDYHPESVRRLLRQKRIKAKKFGRIWLIDPESLSDLRASLKGLSKQDPSRGAHKSG